MKETRAYVPSRRAAWEGCAVDWVRSVKQWVLARPRLRALLRRFLVAPSQLRALSRTARCTPTTSLEPPTHEKPVILVLAFRPWGIHRGWEGALTHQLRASGARVVWATCDGLLSRCDAMLPAFPEAGLCSHCTRFNRDCARTIDAERISITEHSSITDAQRAAVRDDIETGGGAPRLQAHVEASFQRLRAGEHLPPSELKPDELAVWRELMFSAELIDRAAPSLLDRVRPDTVLALNGKFFPESILIEHASNREIPVWTYERGNIRDTIVLAPRPTAVPFDTSAILREIRDQPLSPEQRHRTQEYLRARTRLGNGQVRFVPAGAKGLEAVPTSVPGTTFVLFTNLIWDSGVVGEDTIFGSMFEWIATTVDQLSEARGTRLVIRVHPAESRVYWHPTRDRVADFLAQRYPRGLPENVTLVDALDPIDSYALMRSADIVLTYTSSVGVEAAVLDKPVITTARSNYSSAPFVHAPASVPEYRSLLATAAELAPPPDAAELALRFTHRLYFETMLRMPWIRETSTGFTFDPRRSIDSAKPLEATLRELVRGARNHSQASHRAAVRS